MVSPRCILAFALIVSLCSPTIFADEAPKAKPAMPPAKDLLTQKEMPDPLTFADGRKVATPEQWRLRREEMKAILEEYEYGHMPPAPGNVKGQETSAKDLDGSKTRYRAVHLSFGPEEKLGFDVSVFTPQETETIKAPFPTIVHLSFMGGEKSAWEYGPALRRGYALVTINYQQLAADNANYRKSPFFQAYPDYDWRDISAWAWGTSRAIDYVESNPLFDKSKIVVVGLSRLAQAALLVGAFDDRVAMTAAVGGGCSFRFCGKGRGGKQGVDELNAQNTFWFGPRFTEFTGLTDKLPCDQHWLLALAAPRAFIVINGLDDQYCQANAAAQSYLHAKPVYEFLGVTDRLGVDFRPGKHGMYAPDWETVLDFADLQLLNKGAKRKFDQIPPTDQLR